MEVKDVILRFDTIWKLVVLVEDAPIRRGVLIIVHILA